MGKVRIRLADISKSYYSETAVTQALRHINLTFSEGEFVAITGESGSGKSTLLNIIGGMDTFDDGEMFVDGEPTFQYDETDWEDYRRNKIGYVFQDYSLVGHYTALDNVLSALLIMDQSMEEAKSTALAYLKQVGLEGLETHRANELSSGQKQRLSIARALAKNTGIIVADEPTGNLDTDTGNAIIRLLKELSRDRLVIMVTHNYDQVEPYATRKIRLYDGEIISDVSGVEVSGKEADSAATEEKEEALQDSDEAAAASSGKKSRKWWPSDRKWSQTKTAAYFAKQNRRTQKSRAALFTSFLFIVTVVSFLLIGELYLHADDIFTKVYSDAAFAKEDSTRLVVRHKDLSPITNEDVELLSGISHVVSVDSCDMANDVNFFMEEGVDYKFIYGVIRTWGKTIETKELQFLNYDRYMQSADCISEEDLETGRLPEARNEIVLYSEDEKELGKKKTVYFSARNLWPEGASYGCEMKVVGLLKKPSASVYFSDELCRMMTADADSNIFHLYYSWDDRIQDYSRKPIVIPMIADDLIGDEVRLSKDAPKGDQGWPTGTDILFHYGFKDDAGNETDESYEQTVRVVSDTHESTPDFMEVSQEFFDRYYRGESTQASVYITSYAQTDAVMKDIENLGYEGISTFRVGMEEYDKTLVDNRMIVIVICVFGLIALLLAEVLILRSLMKIRVKDYFVMKFIGMRMQIINRISYFEILSYGVIAMVLTVGLMWILRLSGVAILDEMMWYYGFGAYLIFVVYNLVLNVLTVAAFNYLLKGRLKA